jgi:hypothetical protein
LAQPLLPVNVNPAAGAGSTATDIASVATHPVSSLIVSVYTWFVTGLATGLGQLVQDSAVELSDQLYWMVPDPVAATGKPPIGTDAPIHTDVSGPAFAVHCANVTDRKKGRKRRSSNVVLFPIGIVFIKLRAQMSGNNPELQYVKCTI